MKSHILSHLHEIEAHELDRGPRIETLSRFIAAELDRWEKNSVIHQKRPSEGGKLDELFRTTLAKAWDTPPWG